MAEFTEAHGAAWTATSLAASKDGFLMETNNTIEVTKITKSNSCTATKAYIIIHSSGVELANATFSGNEASFSNIELSVGTEYRVVCDNAGGGYTRQYGVGTITYPVNGTHINWTAGIQDTSTSLRNFNIESITFEYGATPGTDAMNGKPYKFKFASQRMQKRKKKTIFKEEKETRTFKKIRIN